MQTHTEHRQQTTQATALCVDCAHQIDLGDVGLPRICVLPANTGIDVVTGCAAWLPCTLARAADNAHCGPKGRGFKSRSAAGSQLKKRTAGAARPQSWWTSAILTIGGWLAGRHHRHPSEELQLRHGRPLCSATAAGCAQQLLDPCGSTAEPTDQQRSTTPVAPTQAPEATGKSAASGRSAPASSPAGLTTPSPATAPTESSRSRAPGGSPCACAPSHRA